MASNQKNNTDDRHHLAQPQNPPESDTATSEKFIQEPSDGGFAAWMLLLGSFFLVFNTWYAAVFSKENMRYGEKGVARNANVKYLR